MKKNNQIKKAKVTMIFAMAIILSIIDFTCSYSQATNFGVNLAGMEFGHYTNPWYGVPSTATLDYYNSKGLKLVRLPFLWERAQPTLGGVLASTYMADMDRVIANCRARGMSVILDVHNYCRYRDNIIGASGSPVTIAHFADLWQRLATRYANETAVYAYDLMNEPHDMPSSNLWFNIAQAGINAIRRVDNNHIIMVEGDHWANAVYWNQYSDNLKNLVDPANKIVYQAHQYFDANGSGGYANMTVAGNGMNAMSGVEKVRPFVDWLIRNNKKGFIGEYGVPNTGGDVANWNTLLNNLLNYMNQNCVGGTYWAGGEYWGEYKLSCHPVNGVDRPQMSILQRYTSHPSNCTGVVCNPPSSAGAITGLSSVCSGQTVTYTTTSVATATTYNWTVPSGAVITAGSGTTSVTVRYGTTGGNVTVTPANNCGSGTSTSLAVAVQGGAASVSINASATSISPGTIVTFTASAVNGGTSPTYQWRKNGVNISGATSATYSTSAISNNDAFSCIMTSNASCVSGSPATSNTITITVMTNVNQNPTVSITSPANNEILNAPASVNIAVNASDPDGTISKVEFFNGSTMLGEDLTSPYTFQWNNVPAGTYTISARATDNSGATATSSVAIQVRTSTSGPNQLPTVTITSPANGAFINQGDIPVYVNASDSDGSVTKVEFYNGSIYLGEDLTAPYEFIWRNVAPGSYSIVVKAYDNAGASAITNSNIQVLRSNNTNQLPNVQITSPSNGAVFTAPASVTISANASDADGSISKVEFFNGSIKLGEVLSAPYSFNWNNVSSGTYTINVRASDNAGAQASASVNITVNGTIQNRAPVVSITSPSNGASFNAGTNITVTASASDPDGNISRVNFYNGNLLLGSATIAPYSYIIQSATVGTYTLSAIAIDNAGAQTTSASVSVVVNSQNNTVGINGPSCVSQNVSTAFTINPEPGFSSATWWTQGEATITKDPSDNKKVYITYSSNASGTITISCGVSYSSSPWYREYKKTITVGNCGPAARIASNEVTAAPHPFRESTTISMELPEKIISVRLLDLKGTEICEYQNPNHGYELEIGKNLKSGMYILYVITEYGNYTKKIYKLD
ncbi:MAG: Ig-like domain-containing protein [Cytophagaceae bacterium]